MAKLAFSNRIKEVMADMVPRELTGGKWKGKSYPHIYLDKKNNFIDGVFPIKCDIKGNYFGDDKKIKYHNGAAHMNSSQIACINFFKKFFERAEWESILIPALRNVGVMVNCNEIKVAIFEFAPDTKEGTNFDFYLVLLDDTHIFIEVKYTESDFGKINKKDSDKYKNKWRSIYKKSVEKCQFLNCNEADFYANYQINRNISYASEHDIVLFLTPRANDAKGMRAGRNYIDNISREYPNIKNIYWEDLMIEVMKLIANDTDLMNYYEKFSEKYIYILKERDK